MIISEIIEGAVGIWSKGKSGLVRRYRCTAGSRKGRIVSTPTTCNQPKRVSSSINICLLYTSPGPRDAHESRMPSSA